MPIKRAIEKLETVVTKDICSWLRTTIITIAKQNSIHRKKQTTIITHANIKHEVDFQLYPYKKKTVSGCAQM